MTKFISMAIRINVWIQGLFSGFVTNGRYGKWLMDINLLIVLICQMVTLVRRVMVEVCTVPVLLVTNANADLIIERAHTVHLMRLSARWPPTLRPSQPGL